MSVMEGVGLDIVRSSLLPPPGPRPARPALSPGNPRLLLGDHLRLAAEYRAVRLKFPKTLCNSLLLPMFSTPHCIIGEISATEGLGD